VSDTETERWIAALERARAELEAALAAEPHWLALREAVAAHAEHERALAGNPVYRCWTELDSALAALQRGLHGETGGAARRRRVSLRDVLEHLRGETAVQAAKTESHAPPPSPPEPASPGMPPAGASDLQPEAEEATVSFVIREPVRPGAGQDSDDTAAPVPPTAAPEPPKPEHGEGIEADVTIVPRRR
jgi:hypothetical protein